MKRIIKSEKFLYVLIALSFILCFSVVYLKTEKKLNEIKSVTPVVIHDVSYEAEKEETAKKVYVTPSGKKYHLEGCKFLSEKKIPLSYEEAKNAGYESCAYCQP